MGRRLNATPYAHSSDYKNLPLMKQTDIFLQALHVNKQFAAHKALDDVSIAVPRGKVFGLLGHNGAGKTTLIRIINRITAPDSGEVLFDGRPLAEEDIFRIGYLPEERGLYRKMKVGEQALYLARLKGLDERTAKMRLHEWFERFEIMPWWNKKLEELSKGMQQKVQFIITVLHEPPLLIFDEPFSGFDPINAQILKEEILRLKDRGHTVIFSTHNMSSVEEVCDEIALVNRGRIVLEGTVEEAKERHRTGLFDVAYTTGTLTERPELFTLESSVQKGNTTIATLRIASGIDNATLIQALAQEVELRSFVEKVPSMHEIFIKTVETANRTASLNPTGV